LRIREQLRSLANGLSRSKNVSLVISICEAIAALLRDAGWIVNDKRGEPRPADRRNEGNRELPPGTSGASANVGRNKYPFSGPY
jgi:hypothetical protein